MANPLRIGIIGAGGNTRSKHIPGFQAIDGVEVVTIANRTPESAQRVADEFGVPRISKRWQDVIADDAVDAVCIGTWPYLHAEATIDALAAGKHVLTEARMAMNLDEAKKMIAAAQAKPELVAQIVPAPFTLEYDATIQRLLGELGPIRQVRLVHIGGSAADPTAPLTWRQRSDLSGHNIMTMGILFETAQRWLGQGVDVDWVKADAATAIAERPTASGKGHAPVTIPDTLSFLGRYNTGAQLFGHFSCVDHGFPVWFIDVQCERGGLHFCMNDNKLHLTRAGHAPEAITPDAGTAIGWRVEQDFVDSIRDGKPVSLTSFADGVRYMRFTDMVWEAAMAERE
ncbi:Gfo/Idh/MocA family protein [Cerasicoccus fimbriatus]|uniref:Gfo/Idh/MocA family protein n=1 Tax=Cerasicoccus fimbriatus TaxID=3014554 RepID=UPI0022B4D633|nr:Gfo/Idh/MocA family oxidoreductase [Cerasicoccus sp. TK19100]